MDKVTDSAKIVTDELVLKELAKQGMDKDYVEFWHDYAPRSKEHSPFAKFYRDLKSNKRFMVVSGLPKVKPDGQKIEVGWVKQGNKYQSKPNLFSAVVKGRQVQLTCLNDQVTYQPQLFLNNIEVSPFLVKATLLEVDPTNEGYHQNVLEWDYGICKRRVRIIEGRFRERWIFDIDPQGSIRIKHNQTGNFRLKLGRYRISDDEELAPREAFIDPMFGYPFEVGAGTTFYPAVGANSPVDGTVSETTDAVWATIRNAQGDVADDTGDDLIFGGFNSAIEPTWSTLYRCIMLFDIGAIAGSTITATTFSAYGNAKLEDYETDQIVNVYLSTPANNNALVAGDFIQVHSTPYCDTPLGYDDWSLVGYNHFIFNADPGIVAVQAAADGDGILKLGGRDVLYDIGGNVPTWQATGWNYLIAFTADKGTGFKPKLVVTYEPAGWAGGDVGGVAIAAIAKINGVALADIVRVNGVA